MLTKQSKRLRLSRNKRNFSKMKVDYYRYVKDFYLEDGLAYISCNVNDYHDVISAYSVEGYEWLNEEFADFVESNSEYIPVEYPIVLEICGGAFSKEQQDTIVETIHDYYELKLGDKQLDLRNNTYRIVLFMVSGIIVTGILLLAQKLSAAEFVSDMIVILVWFFIWELCGLILFDRQEIKEDKMAAAQLAAIEVRFKNVFEDIPLTESEKENIYERIGL